MSYEFYKVVHLMCLILVVSCLGIGFFSGTPRKWARMLGMGSSLFLFIAGFGLLAKGNFSPWPLWVKIKIVIWVVLAGSGPILAKRLKSNREIAFFGLLALFSAAIILAVVKPYS